MKPLENGGLLLENNMERYVVTEACTAARVDIPTILDVGKEAVELTRGMSVIRKFGVVIRLSFFTRAQRQIVIHPEATEEVVDALTLLAIDPSTSLGARGWAKRMMNDFHHEH